MEKEKLIYLVEQFYQEALSANSYYLILQQYAENQKKHLTEMQASPAFYTITHNALIEALFMNLAKIYDLQKDAIDIRQLLEKCKKNIEFFPEYEINIPTDGEERIETLLDQHTVKQNEEWYFKDEVETQNKFAEALGLQGTPVVVKLTIEQYFDFYDKKFCSLNPKIKNLRVQRNKIYAHNDSESIFDIDAVIKKNPLNMADIRVLIEYALEVSRFLLGRLTRILKPDKYGNIDDLGNTLRLVQIGEKYRDAEMKARMQTLMEQ